jgi:hypothetical protein
MIGPIRQIGLIGLVLLTGGCAHVRDMGALPRPEEFSKSRYELQKEYPELVAFDRGVVGGYTLNDDRGHAEALVEAWGKPQGWSMSPLNFLPLTGILRTRTHWTWWFADKQIEARIGHYWLRGYQPEVVWIDIKLADEPAK